MPWFQVVGEFLVLLGGLVGCGGSGGWVIKSESSQCHGVVGDDFK